MSNDEEVPVIELSDKTSFDRGLSVDVSIVKDGENASLKCYFGFLMRSESIIDKSHKYCNECLKQEKITRYEKCSVTVDLK